MRTYALKRWNWSEKSKKWVYVEKIDGKRTYKYNSTPPEEFEDLSKQLRDLNQKLMVEKNPEKNIELYKDLIALSQRMQAMRE
jgi:hypothetical protein